MTDTVKRYDVVRVSDGKKYTHYFSQGPATNVAVSMSRRGFTYEVREVTFERVSDVPVRTCVDGKIFKCS